MFIIMVYYVLRGYIRGREAPEARAFICGANILSFKIIVDFKVH